MTHKKNLQHFELLDGLRGIAALAVVIIGSVLGIFAFLLDPYTIRTVQEVGNIAVLFVGSIFMIPMPWMEERAYNLFSFNAPAWSLFWEYVASICYGLFLYRLRKRSHLLLLLLAATGIVFVSLRAGNLLGGWSKDSFLDGGARVAYSFLAGLALYRFNWVIKNQLSFPALAGLLLLAFIMPLTKLNWLKESLVVLFYFPLLIALGAGSSASGFWKKFCLF